MDETTKTSSMDETNATYMQSHAQNIHRLVDVADEEAYYVADTRAHVELVQQLMHGFSEVLTERAALHDASKFEEPEKSIFSQHTRAFTSCQFGTDAYRQHQQLVQEALHHHYRHNRHHPEHHPNGIADMNLYDIVEMFCDWSASSVKNNQGDVVSSILACQKRFGMSDELTSILINTVTRR